MNFQNDKFNDVVIFLLDFFIVVNILFLQVGIIFC